MQKAVSLVILMVLCAAPAAEDACADQGDATEAQKLAAQIVREMGGQVMELAQNDPRLDVSYHLADGVVTNAHLVPLKHLKDLVNLNLRGTEITDDGLEHLSGITSLARLHLEKTAVTDKGLVHLQNMKNLEYLNLYGTSVTDAGLAQLKELKNLKKLYVWNTDVTLEGEKSLFAAVEGIQIVPDLIARAKKAEQAKMEADEAQARADEAQKKAEQATAAVEEAKKRAEEAQQAAEQTQQRAEEAKRRAEDLAKRVAAGTREPEVKEAKEEPQKDGETETAKKQ